MTLDALFAIAGTITGLSKEEMVDAAIHPEKQPEMLHKISENIKAETAAADFATGGVVRNVVPYVVGQGRIDAADCLTYADVAPVIKLIHETYNPSDEEMNEPKARN